jgi:hypothetical protein
MRNSSKEPSSSKSKTINNPIPQILFNPPITSNIKIPIPKINSISLKNSIKFNITSKTNPNKTQISLTSLKPPPFKSKNLPSLKLTATVSKSFLHIKHPKIMILNKTNQLKKNATKP